MATRETEALLDHLAKFGPSEAARELVEGIGTSCASFIAAIDSDSSTVARYLAQRLDPLVALAATDIRVHNALVAIATDGRKLAAGTEQGRG